MTGKSVTHGAAHIHLYALAHSSMQARAL